MTQGNFLETKESEGELVQKVASLIRSRREELNISQSLLSEMTGIQRAYVSRLENGRRPGLTFGIVAKLFTALNIKFAEIDEL